MLRPSGRRSLPRAFGLGGDRWTRLPDLPQPGRGRVVDVATASYGGADYALAGVVVWWCGTPTPRQLYRRARAVAAPDAFGLGTGPPAVGRSLPERADSTSKRRNRAFGQLPNPLD